MKSLAKRSYELELIDDATIDFLEFQETLQQLEQINQQTGSYRPSLEAFDLFLKKVKHDPREPLKILDIGFGYGDLLRKIYFHAQSQGYVVELTGIDLNPWSKKAAQLATSKTLPIRYLTQDVFDVDANDRYHLIFTSLMMHHLADDLIVRLMQWMTRHADYGWCINDLHRHFLAYYFIDAFVKSKNYNRLIRHDAPLSVARGFKREDWQSLLEQSQLDLDHVSVNWCWPFRWRVCYAITGVL